MTINTLPAHLQAMVQDGFLDREFAEGLSAKVGYRDAADREVISTGIGEKLTKTRQGLKAPVGPMDPALNTGLDNGITASRAGIEQYDLTMKLFADGTDLNIVTSTVAAARNQFLTNAKGNGKQAVESLDLACRNALFGAYMGGNTRVTGVVTTAVAVPVDDIRGFEYVAVNNVMVPVSGSAPMAAYIDGNLVSVVGVAADGTNVSTAFGGVSGILTLAVAITAAVGEAVSGEYAPTILRAGGRATTALLQTADLFNLSVLLDAITQLDNNGVERDGGLFNVTLNHTSFRHLVGDGDFLAWAGINSGTASAEARNTGFLEVAAGARFKLVNTAPIQAMGALKVQRPVVYGKGALIEGQFQGMLEHGAAQGVDPSEISIVDGVAHVTKAPQDRLGQVVKQSWYSIAGHAAPTDVTASQSIIPSAAKSYLKRAVIIEHA